MLEIGTVAIDRNFPFWLLSNTSIDRTGTLKQDIVSTSSAATFRAEEVNPNFPKDTDDRREEKTQSHHDENNYARK